MFQRKINELYQGLLNIFGIADDFLIGEFDNICRNHDATFDKVLGYAGRLT